MAPDYRLHPPRVEPQSLSMARTHYLGVHGSAESKVAYKRLVAEYKSSGMRLCYGLARNQSTVTILICDYQDWAQQRQPVKQYDQICYALKHLEDYHDVK